MPPHTPKQTEFTGPRAGEEKDAKSFRAREENAQEELILSTGWIALLK